MKLKKGQKVFLRILCGDGRLIPAIVCRVGRLYFNISTPGKGFDAYSDIKFSVVTGWEHVTGAYSPSRRVYASVKDYADEKEMMSLKREIRTETDRIYASSAPIYDIGVLRRILGDLKNIDKEDDE